MRLNAKPLIDDVAATYLRNKVYEAQDAQTKLDDINKHVNDLELLLFEVTSKTDKQIYSEIDSLSTEKKYCIKVKHRALEDICTKILKLVPAPVFEDSNPDVVPDKFLGNGDCYMLMNFVEFLCKRGLMDEQPTFTETKQLIFDFDNFLEDEQANTSKLAENRF